MNGFSQKLAKIIVTDEIVAYFSKLYNARESKEKLKEYYLTELRLLIVILILGVILTIVFSISDKKTTEIQNGLIERNTYGMGKRPVTLDVYREADGNVQSVTFDVDEVKYDEKTVKILANNLKKELDKRILAENVSKDHVSKPLSFENKIADYPFYLKYETSNPLIISNDGKLDSKKIEETDSLGEGILVRILVTITYEEYKEEYELFVNVFSPQKSFEEKYIEAIERELGAYNEKTRMTEYMTLPESISGIKVSFKNKNPHNAIIVGMLSITALLGIHYARKNEIKKLVDIRNQQMISDYPKVLNKFALYFNAGMPIKAIWIKICEEYMALKASDGETRYVFEELLISYNKMKEGVPELEAYEDFSKRCGLPVYRSFVNQIEQAVIKGKRDVGEMFSKEVIEAFNVRKMNARKLSEEASTKLLVPMFMMLLVVIVMIIFPAFYSMKL